MAKPRTSVGSIFGAINDASQTAWKKIDDLNENLKKQLEAKNAVKSLYLDADMEETVVRAAMDRARISLDEEAMLKSKVSIFKELYDEEYAKLSLLLNSKDLNKDTSRVFLCPKPSFEQIPHHSDPEVNELICENVDIIKKKRNAFFLSVYKELSGNPALYRHFLKMSQEYKIEHCLSLIDPDKKLKEV